jgi:hypothetical protein
MQLNPATSLVAEYLVCNIHDSLELSIVGIEVPLVGEAYVFVLCLGISLAIDFAPEAARLVGSNTGGPVPGAGSLGDADSGGTDASLLGAMAKSSVVEAARLVITV